MSSDKCFCENGNLLTKSDNYFFEVTNVFGLFWRLFQRLYLVCCSESKLTRMQQAPKRQKANNASSDVDVSTEECDWADMMLTKLRDDPVTLKTFLTELAPHLPTNITKRAHGQLETPPQTSSTPPPKPSARKLQPQNKKQVVSLLLFFLTLDANNT